VCACDGEEDGEVHACWVHDFGSDNLDALVELRVLRRCRVLESLLIGLNAFCVLQEGLKNWRCYELL